MKKLSLFNFFAAFSGRGESFHHIPLYNFPLYISAILGFASSEKVLKHHHTVQYCHWKFCYFCSRKSYETYSYFHSSKPKTGWCGKIAKCFNICYISSHIYLSTIIWQHFRTPSFLIYSWTVAVWKLYGHMKQDARHKLFIKLLNQ